MSRVVPAIIRRAERLGGVFYHWRLRALGARLSLSASIAPTARVRGDCTRFAVGDRTAIGDFVHIWVSGGVEIGNDTLIAAHTVITSQSHDPSAGTLGLNYRETKDDAAVRIGSNVWIASNSVIARGVSVGDGAIVAAGAVVLEDVPAGCLVGGVPARIIRHLV